jgi:hypothetical protein
MTRASARAKHSCIVAAIGAALLAAGRAEVASADDAGEPIHLEYRAGAGCPGEEAFVARVHARMARVRLVGAAEGARTFTVELSNAREHPSGSVTVTGRARSEGARRLQADTCDEVADALALMVVLAIDPGALSAPEASPATPSAIDAGAPALLDAAAPLDASSPLDASTPLDRWVGPDAATAPSSPVPPAISPAPTDSTPAALSTRPRHFFGGGDFAIATGVTPSALFTGAPFIGWRMTEGSLLGASVRVAFLRVGTGTVTVVDGGADFTWTVGRVDGCALLWPSRSLRLGACARVEAGVLEVVGKDVPAPRTWNSPWVAVGTLARLEWSFFGPLVLDVEAGPSFHVSAEEFYFEPYGRNGTSGYTVPYVGFVSEAGVGIHFL